MPKLTETKISCGIRNLSGFCNNPDRFDRLDHIKPRDILLKAFDTTEDCSEDWLEFPATAQDITFSIVLFSDSVRRGNGKKLAAFIKKNKLGKVTASDISLNPNTGNEIQLWTWYLNRSAVVEWLHDNHGYIGCEVCNEKMKKY